MVIDKEVIAIEQVHYDSPLLRRGPAMPFWAT